MVVVLIQLFVWDWVVVEVDGFDESIVNDVFKMWFFVWFDVDDENMLVEDGLYGIVYYLLELVCMEQGWCIYVDFGFVLEMVVEDLLFWFVDVGVMWISVG